ncbi:13275_t:CDS:2 [Cetraspora pellucida]|uniref:13275_t:CDS:1 n=1 Tax=Cetraspora pellucida TaxID=1433469 RepID=A0A9N8W9Q9_9GLOM|nr:13275_t:CDS:2 [Cetraspora pellucida]
MPLKEQLESILERRKKRDLCRSLVIASPSSVDFSSNDFLGLSRNKVLNEKFLNTLITFPHPPLGSTGSRLLDGNSSYAESLDKFLAEFHNAESALMFTSGFDANVGFFSSVPQPGDAVIIDEFVHASVHDGVRNSRASLITSFKHNDVENLKLVLENVITKIGTKNNIFVAVESLYSMDGDFSPLKEIVETLRPFNAYLFVDEACIDLNSYQMSVAEFSPYNYVKLISQKYTTIAHSNGVYGYQGRGIVSELGLERHVFARLHTFGKALASNGAVILGPKILRSYLINYARPLIFSTFLSYNNLISIKCSYEVMSSEIGDQLRQNLMKLINIFRSNIKLPHDVLLPSTSAIQGIIVPGNENAVKLSRIIQKVGYNVKPIRSPTVPVGKERVRICIHADNTEEEILGLISVIEDYFKENMGIRNNYISRL